MTRVACLFIKCLECKCRSRSSTDLEPTEGLENADKSISLFFGPTSFVLCISPRQERCKLS